MIWQCFQKVIAGKTKDGDDKKITQLVTFQTKSCNFIAYLKAKLKAFIIHNFVQRWQDSKFKECLITFPKDVVLSVIDFAENYSFQTQNEIQEMHWFSIQITILVHIMYRHNPEYDPMDPKSKGPILKEYHYYISDDRIHDTLFVQHCFELHWIHLTSTLGVYPAEHWVWSDGCSSQFKSSRCWYHVSRYPAKTVSAQLPSGC